MNQHKRLKNTFSIVRDIYLKHPDWNARQIYDMYLILIGDTMSKAVTLNAIQKQLENIKEITKTERYKELESPWHMGTLEEHPIPAEAIPCILKELEWGLWKLPDLVFTIRQAQWAARLYAFPSLRKRGNLYLASYWYAHYEMISELAQARVKKLAKLQVDTTMFDDALYNFTALAQVASHYNYGQPDAIQNVYKQHENLSVPKHIARVIDV